MDVFLKQKSNIFVFQDQDHTNDSGMASSMDESSGSVDLTGNGNKNKKKTMVGKNSSKPNGKFFPDPRDPVQINNHIYEYLVSKRVAEEHRRSQDNLINEKYNVKRRGSLSSSPSDGSSTNNSKQPDFSSGKPDILFFLTAKSLVFADCINISKLALIFIRYYLIKYSEN